MKNLPPLQFKITAKDTTQAAFTSVKKAVSGVTKSVFSLKTAIGGVVGAAGLGLLVKTSLDAVDALGKTSAKLDVASDSLQRLRYAANLAGVETRTVDMAVQRFTRRLSEAANGTGEAKDALKELGIDAAKLAQLPLEEQMLQLADSFDQVSSGGDRVRLAFKLFDSEGVAFLNTLKNGRQELAKTFGEADKLGGILSNKSVKAAEAANDAFLRLKTVLVGFRDQIVVRLAPAITQLVGLITDSLLGAAQSGAGGMEEFAGRMAKAIIEFVADSIEAFGALVNRTGQLIDDIRKVAHDTSNLFDLDTTSFMDVDKVANRLVKTVEKLGYISMPWSDSGDHFAEFKRQILGIISPLRNMENVTVEAIDNMIAAINRLMQQENMDFLAGNEITRQLETLKQTLASVPPEFERLFDGIDVSGAVDTIRDLATGTEEFSTSASDASVSTTKLDTELQDLMTSVDSLLVKLDKENKTYADLKGSIEDNIKVLKLQKAGLDAEVMVLQWSNQLKQQGVAVTDAMAASLQTLADEYVNLTASSESAADVAERHAKAINSAISGLEKELTLLTSKTGRLTAEQRGLEIINQLKQDGVLITQSLTNEVMNLTSAIEQQRVAEEDAAKARKAALERSRQPLQSYAKQVRDTAGNIQTAMVNAFKGAEDAFVQFAQTGKFNMKSLADAIISDLLRIAIQRAIIGPWLAAFGFSGGGYAGFSQGGPVGSPRGYAVGGMVRGGGGPTSDSIPAMLSNGEFVVNAKATAQHRSLLEAVNNGDSIRMPGRGGGPSRVEVNVINNSGSEARVEESQGSDGQSRIDVIIDQAVGRSLRGGSGEKVLRGRYGLTPALGA